ncbi:MAG TPA: P-II family nitrogen regulator [Chthonomonadales bacterium]|nr:P-II family nitrogen regulator [Chthonomonadales bacterium]
MSAAAEELATVLMLVEAIVRPQKVCDSLEALARVGARGVTVTDARGAGRQRGVNHQYRGSEYTVSLLHKVKIEVVVAEREARVVAEALARAAHTGEIGDGKIFLVPVLDAIRIRTGDRGRVAID